MMKPQKRRLAVTMSSCQFTGQLYGAARDQIEFILLWQFHLTTNQSPPKPKEYSWHLYSRLPHREVSYSQRNEQSYLLFRKCLRESSISGPISTETGNLLPKERSVQLR